MDRKTCRKQIEELRGYVNNHKRMAKSLEQCIEVYEKKLPLAFEGSLPQDERLRYEFEVLAIPYYFQQLAKKEKEFWEEEGKTEGRLVMA